MSSNGSHPEADGLREAARLLLERNTIRSGPRVYTAPSPPHYSDQWNWDSRLVSLVWAELDPDRAAGEMEALFSHQRSDGSLPMRAVGGLRPPGGKPRLHTHLDRAGAWFVQRQARLTQPPLPVLDTLAAAGTPKERLRPLLDAETRHLLWLRKERADDDGLLRILHPWESGMDAKPAYDGVHRMDGRHPVRAGLALWGRLMGSGLRHGWHASRMAAGGRFAVKDTLFNSLYAANLRAVAGLHRTMGDPDIAHRFEGWAADMERAMLERMYDDRTGFFYDVGPRGNQLRVKAVSGFAPLLLASLPKDIAHRLVEEHLEDPARFWSAFPVPSVAIDEPTHDPGRAWPLWRGPTWINTNFFVWKGLRLHGFTRTARELANRTRLAVTRYGFHEFYDPRSGVGLRPQTQGFAWSTLAVLMAE